MGRRRGGGGAGKPRPSSLEQTLRRRIESVKHKYPTADDIAAHLRSTVPQYNRLPNFTTIVERTLKHLRPDKPSSTSSPEPPFFIEDSDDSPVRKRSRRRGGDAMSSSSSSDSEETDESDVEPEFDVTKSMLRESYQKVATVLKSDGKAPKRTDLTDSNDGVALKSGGETPKGIDLSHLTDSADDDTVLDSAKSKKVMKRDKNVEIEVVSNSNNVKTPKKGDLLRKNEKGTSKEGKDLGGTRFKHLGGMSEIIEGLKSEVLFPLFNPEMLRKLGVNPIKGILLKGPPGCGKTKLAHAVTNEAGVPFYKIAATE